MKKVNFYLLPEQTDLLQFSCKLALQLWRKRKPDQYPSIWILGTDQLILQQLDELLWTHDWDTFTPHQIYQSHNPQPINTPICLSQSLPLPDWQGIIFNFTSYPLTEFANIEIMEIVDHQETSKVQARERYRHYAKSGFEISHYQLKAS